MAREYDVTVIPPSPVGRRYASALRPGSAGSLCVLASATATRRGGGPAGIAELLYTPHGGAGPPNVPVRFPDDLEAKPCDAGPRPRRLEVDSRHRRAAVEREAGSRGGRASRRPRVPVRPSPAPRSAAVNHARHALVVVSGDPIIRPGDRGAGSVVLLHVYTTTAPRPRGAGRGLSGSRYPLDPFPHFPAGASANRRVSRRAAEVCSPCGRPARP